MSELDCMSDGHEWHAATPSVHTFADSGEAYDATQTDEELHDGETIIVPSEHVVGVVYTWPLAVTVVHGALHRLIIPATVAADRDVRGLRDGILAAIATAERFGWAVVIVGDEGI